MPAGQTQLFPARQAVNVLVDAFLVKVMANLPDHSTGYLFGRPAQSQFFQFQDIFLNYWMLVNIRPLPACLFLFV
ncbi:hypothetical protein COU03_02185 [bacterium (Candidatus Gribaldobacteria) CG10_big_fil_rev_8_21_14_0_10_41_12]|uniref:Uncharacterized protein n=1 Tax=bacterium (Candidatus Gribaldobacteria) CG10_big_fil_rev_8_21_14_0_10_41_12 TaxID=2014277 RepID=A0A2H0UZ99_9BACT|nr:MAG: hypothetical protein COU03_02185 [bacterium (Candidatus Gribaldobacteria) CG10_big_fil_rev_8_21_14_0_10_41_12]